MIHGGYAKSTIKILFPLLLNDIIHIPSPMRLLRLVNGKRCEFCNTKRVNHVRPGFGVFTSMTCLTKNGDKTLTSILIPSYCFEGFENPRNNLVRKHRRIDLRLSNSSCCVWHADRTATIAAVVGSSTSSSSEGGGGGGNEKIGPLVTIYDVNAIVKDVDGSCSIDEYLKK